MADQLAGLQIDFLVLDAAPDSFDEHVVTAAATAIHRPPDAPAEHRLGERARRELAPLIDAHDVGPPVVHRCLFEYLNSVGRFQRDCDPVRKHLVARRVHHCRQIDAATHHRNVRRVECPGRIGPFDLQAVQQIRTDIVLCVAAARFRPEVVAPNTSAASSCNCRFHSVPWFGCPSNCFARWAGVCSPLAAADVTSALNAKECVSRVVVVSFSGSFTSIISGAGPGRSTCPAVRVCATTSRSLPIESKSVMYVTTLQSRKLSNG
jgi:hypothetical protein